MQQFVIQGGGAIRGEVNIAGAKNAALPILMAAILSDDISRITNVPMLKDIDTSLSVLEGLGISSTFEQEEVILKPGPSLTHKAPYELVKTMRASILVLGPLLTKHGDAEVSLPGGCAIGARPVNLHIEGLQKMGAQITVENGYVKGSVQGRLQGAHLFMDIVSVGATENLMMAACLAEGETVIENAAREPEVVDLANCLIGMGAKIEGAGTDTIHIYGVERLSGADHSVLPDRIETGTFLVAAAATHGEIVCHRANAVIMDAVLDKLIQAGAQVEYSADHIHLSMHHRELHSVDIKTSPHPGFPTDMQAQFTVLNTVAQGVATITENIFENRFMHVPELQRMGANIRLEGNTAICGDPHPLSGAQVMATDLRASASLVIAGVLAEGETIVDRIYHIDRGYSHIEEKLTKLGVSILRRDTH
ncbi:UDP-N-acetylglucosamine 1-carboxyvinyltransferase [Algicola sagamiensis]|uniref:UDP-N-acetylglucosamine 1-carboxyvinyltransferase n=1 Tax=Algicola sagamiensis TaxID=163869 RepID=UPI00035D6A21|nr:UDP-N-acetylglucosamine 1-carboxyvinyltransferase [Algicola sagamiensis]